jgi:hypothetical protein
VGCACLWGLFAAGAAVYGLRQFMRFIAAGAAVYGLRLFMRFICRWRGGLWAAPVYGVYLPLARRFMGCACLWGLFAAGAAVYVGCACLRGLFAAEAAFEQKRKTRSPSWGPGF